MHGIITSHIVVHGTIMKYYTAAVGGLLDHLSIGEVVSKSI